MLLRVAHPRDCGGGGVIWGRLNGVWMGGRSWVASGRLDEFYSFVPDPDGLLELLMGDE